MSKQTFICYYCGKSFKARPLARGKPRKFCDQKCYGLNKRILSEDQYKEIISMYIDGGSMLGIAKIFGIAHTTVKDALARADIEIGGLERYRKYTLNERRFDDIDDEQTAYWLGFIYADGYVRRNDLTVRIKEGDKKHLKKLRQWLLSDTKIIHHNSDQGNTVRITFGSKHLANQLMRLGVVPYRPNFNDCSEEIPEYLIAHFTRGLIDGDGYITKKGSHTSNVGFCGQKDAVQWMKNTLIEKCDLKGNPKIRVKTQNSYEVAFGGIFQTKKILSFVYDDANIYLDRKKVLADYWINKRTSRNGY